MPEVLYKLSVEGYENARAKILEANKTATEGQQALNDAMLKQIEIEQKRELAQKARMALGLEKPPNLKPVVEATVEATEKTVGLRDAFKRVAETVGSVAGESNGKLARMSAGALGVTEALGAGGVMGATTALTVAIGLGAAAWDAWKDHVAKGTRDAEESVKRVAEAFAHIGEQAAQAADFRAFSSKGVDELRAFEDAAKTRLKLIQESERVAAEADVARYTAERKNVANALWEHGKFVELSEKIADAKRRVVEWDQKEASVVRDINLAHQQRAENMRQEFELAKIDAHNQRALEAEKRATERASIRANERAQNGLNSTMSSAYSTDITFIGGIPVFGLRSGYERAKAQWQADTDEATAKQAELRRMEEANIDELTKKYNEALDAMEKVTQAQQDGAVAAQNRILQDEKSTTAQKIAATRAIAEVDIAREKSRSERYQADQRDMATMQEGYTQQAAILIEEDNKLSKARIANREAETEATIAALKRQEEAQKKATEAQLYDIGVTTAQSAAMDAMQPVVMSLANKMQTFADINRENYKEKLAFTEELPALIAKEAQAVLWGIALQAGAKSAVESAEATAAFATALGMVALGLPNSEPMFMSAATHAAAAAAYGALGGGAGAVSLGIGASRGEGGLVGLTKEEKAGMSGGASSSGGGSSRVGSGGYGGSDSGPSPVNNTYYIYSAGSIDASDRASRNQTVAAATRENARNPFTQREMTRSV